MIIIITYNLFFFCFNSKSFFYVFGINNNKSLRTKPVHSFFFQFDNYYKRKYMDEKKTNLQLKLAQRFH